MSDKKKSTNPAVKSLLSVTEVLAALGFVASFTSVLLPTARRPEKYEKVPVSIAPYTKGPVQVEGTMDSTRLEITHNNDVVSLEFLLRGSSKSIECESGGIPRDMIHLRGSNDINPDSVIKAYTAIIRNGRPTAVVDGEMEGRVFRAYEFQFKGKSPQKFVLLNR